ncbi:MAG: hypothetical protein IPM79_08815 [Polyangiaceae bacterium]|nr:hypothetical protein [Polyangiaceae bacterium]
MVAALISSMATPAFAEETPAGEPSAVAAQYARAPMADPQQVAELGRIRRQSIAVRRSLSAGVVGAGLASLIGGLVLVIPETDSGAMRIAGINTLAFGAVNVVVGSIALAGIRAEEAEWEEDRSEERKTAQGFQRHLFHALADERREAVSHGINLGLASAYAAASIATIVGSQFGVDEPQRWMASGISIGAQALFLLVIDAIGTTDAGSQYESIEALAASALSVSLGPDGGGVAITRAY